MPRVPVRETASVIADLREFTSNGEMRATIDQNYNYVVYSYSTPILLVEQDGKTAHINGLRYSNTTSRHQNLCKKALEIRGVEKINTHNTTPEAFEQATGYRVRRSVSHY